MLVFRFIADLRSAQNDNHRGLNPLYRGDDFSSGRDIPDVHPEPDNPRLPGEELLSNIDGPLINIEFDHRRTGSKCSKIRHQISQPKRRMNVLGIQSGQNNLSHRKLKSNRGVDPGKSGCF